MEPKDKNIIIGWLVFALAISSFFNYQLYDSYRNNNMTISENTKKVQSLNTTIVDLESKNSDLTKQVNELTQKVNASQFSTLRSLFSSQSYEEDEYLCEGYATVCSDESCSNSTGRGTCSWHGGVWYYN